jgi:cobalt-zinc-cadmium efflux system protein
MLRAAFVVQLAFLVIEVVGGLSFNSLALLSDAAHMLADVGAIGLALFAAALAKRPATAGRTYGFARAEVLAALANSTTLLLASVWIIVEAVQRFAAPQAVGGNGVAIVAALGIAANLVTAGFLMRADRENLNVRATLIHSLIDAMSCGAVLLSGVLIAATGVRQIDSVASLLIAFMAITGTWGVFKSAMNLLLDAAPASCDGDAVRAALMAHPAVAEVDDVRVWSIGQREVAVSAHLRAAPGASIDARLVDSLRRELEHRFGVTHATLQLLPADHTEAAPQLTPTPPVGGGHDHGHDRAHVHAHGHSHAH